MGELSKTSGPEAVIIPLLRKLDEEKFLRNPTDLEAKRPGELGMECALVSLSPVGALVRDAETG